MSSINRIRSSVKPQPVATRTSVVLFDATRRHPASYFGRGILPAWRGEYRREGHTSQDEAWAAQCFSHADVWREAAMEAELSEREMQIRWDSQFVA